MEENKRPTSMFDSCMKQIMKNGDRMTMEINMNGDVEFTFLRKNGNFGTHTMEYDVFSKLLNSDIHIEMLLSNCIEVAYNDLMGKEGNSTRLEV